MSSHKFDLNKKGIRRECKAGRRILVNAKAFPSLHNMALATITLKKGGVREPHWHPNADELTYCLKGKALITVFSPHNGHDTFTLSEGEVVSFPRGYIHHLENIYDGETKFILAYDSNAPEDLDLSESIASMTPHVLASTFSSKPEVFEKILEKAKDSFISKKSTESKPKAAVSSHFKFDLERIKPQIKSRGGLARIVNRQNFPQLEHLALFSLRVAKKGIREPHWHPNATELNFVVKGKARLTLFSPGGKKDTFDLAEGQGSIIPRGYFHHIENRGSGELHMTVYFNHPEPNDIGLSGAMSAFSEEVLASLFSVEPALFAKLKKFQEDRMIVQGGG